MHAAKIVFGLFAVQLIVASAASGRVHQAGADTTGIAC
jgi:hypothetical protein